MVIKLDAFRDIFIGSPSFSADIFIGVYEGCLSGLLHPIHLHNLIIEHIKIPKYTAISDDVLTRPLYLSGTTCPKKGYDYTRFITVDERKIGKISFKLNNGFVKSAAIDCVGHREVLYKNQVHREYREEDYLSISDGKLRDTEYNGEWSIIRGLSFPKKEPMDDYVYVVNFIDRLVLAEKIKGGWQVEIGNGIDIFIEDIDEFYPIHYYRKIKKNTF